MAQDAEKESRAGPGGDDPRTKSRLEERPLQDVERERQAGAGTRMGSGVGQTRSGQPDAAGALGGSAGEETLKTLVENARTAIRQAARSGSDDLSSTAKGLAQNAIRRARELGIDASRAASAVARACAEAAEESGAANATQVRGALSGATIDDVRIDLATPGQQQRSWGARS